MKVGDYVRTKRGQIHKITNLKGYYENNKLIEDRQYVYIDNHFSGWDLGQFQELIDKSSPNIIDLIEAGDYVNGLKVEGVNNEIKGFGTIIFSKDSSIMEDYIYSIVTKEQFESMKYKVKG